MTLEHAVDERVDLVLLADVADARLNAPAVGPRRGLLERVAAAPAHHHARAQGGQLEGARAAQAGAAAADDRHLAGEQLGLEELRGHGRANVTRGLC